ncbi:Lipocalin-like domain-containing protein [Tenacibaculum sp. 190130A14a]|uniref:Lipocalin-like domain-containing protein n=1 Tax=Tenacibaculum polynesiense TaxID=3137857 RepID=A0ABM9PCW0_9FLAO
MRKLLCLALIAISLFACSDNTETLDPFVGTWYFFSENGKEVDACNNKSTITVSENGNFTAINYGNQDNSNECIIENTFNATWVKKGTDTYELTEKSTGIKEVYTIIFSDKSNTFKSETVIDNITETTTFKRK